MGWRFDSNTRRIVRSGRTDYPRNRAFLTFACSLACGRTRQWPSDFVCPKRPHGSLGFAVFQLARTCGSVRRSRAVVVPDRSLPHLRMRTDRRKCPLSTRSAGAPSCRKCLDLLFNAQWRHGNRPVIGRSGTSLQAAPAIPACYAKHLTRSGVEKSTGCVGRPLSLLSEPRVYGVDGWKCLIYPALRSAADRSGWVVKCIEPSFANQRRREIK